ncbi:MAG: MATE family efflux transporter [Bullifex sp.]
MAEISSRDEAFRHYTLTTPRLTKLIISVCTPLAVHQFVTQLFNILDTVMASYISAEAVSTVAYLVQLQHIVSAIGGGLSVAGGIRIASFYGKGDFDRVRKELSGLVLLCMVISALIICLLPFTPFILKLTGTPQLFIEEGSRYFSIVIAGVVINFFNSVYIAVEKARGNTKLILRLNIMVIMVKLTLTALFIYVFRAGITMIAFATAVSYLSLFTFGIRKLTHGNDAFTFSLKEASLGWSSIGPLVRLAIPTIIEKMSFSFGKALVNNMSASYGETVVGAAGISNNMSGLLTGLQTGYQDGGTSLISQNMGAGLFPRAVRIFVKFTCIQFLIGCAGNFLYLFLMEPISHVFSVGRGGYSPEFQSMIIMIFRHEILGCFCLSFCYASQALLLGFARTRAVLLINIFRIFVFRIPVIWYFTNMTDTGAEAVGYTMMISNTLTGLFALLIAITVIMTERKKLSTQARASRRNASREPHS